MASPKGARCFTRVILTYPSCSFEKMSKAIFTSKIDPTYDDLPEDRYHFPSSYLNRVQQSVGDWIVYYEPRRKGDDPNSLGGRQAYFGMARVVNITQDASKLDHYYAHVVDYLDFDYPVPFKEGSYYYESALVKSDGSTNKGAFGHAVRIISDNEFSAIVQSGFAPVIREEEILVKQQIKEHRVLGFNDEAQEEFKRPIITRLSNRPFRDAAFSKLVKDMYHQTCAMTGLKIINGGGRSEVHAAHIKPVEENGPDSIRNGIALSGTVHWMFDRGLVSIDEDFSILKAKGKIPDSLIKLLNADGKITIPTQELYKPHARYLQFHREHVFKG